MVSLRFAQAGGVLVALAGVTAVSAQDDRMLRPPETAEAIIYRDAGYKGPAVNVSRAEPDLDLSFRVNAIRVRSGTWQVCERPDYRGTCRSFNRDTPLIAIRGMVVQSMRPEGGNSGGGTWPGGEPGNNPSLRGMAAQFYPAPAQRGMRVEACVRGNATAECAQRSAAQFCREMGWRTSARQMMETVRGRVYLADVLCSNTGM